MDQVGHAFDRAARARVFDAILGTTDRRNPNRSSLIFAANRLFATDAIEASAMICTADILCSSLAR